MSVTSVRLPASKTAKKAIIFLHGLGDSGQGWSWFPQVMKQTGLLKSQDEVNFVFPNAPEIPISVNNGYRMPGWFDIYQFGGSSPKQDREGFLKSCDVVKALIQEQMDTFSIAPENIIIGGFSQGSALSMAALALLDIKIGGVVALSGFCPIPEAIKELHNKNGVNFETPVFQGHGDEDPIIGHSVGQDASKFYQDLGFKNWTFNTYRGVAHSTNEQELVDAIKFISLVLDK
ncbi:Phospholipase/carboxylesterase [Metschnikowia bicuspidata var. bicuspidata NRRL YB-4993]|uniref:Acyl-protein thioesterase 1 n=1 Tax=Metschnikowia bicuspidata var. bicuspidata NRRL YB-4993 TaxID=869754 RepID=A0A1A0HD03_9ASCO|nr:Phospholipase/carboxylesterase [Metschnikowia bicuspidata var. bicuspidata NRRL YB-4993]OBA21891.1 Phospholipase/carboxylesterase [Metschnikowia bicuspidata var. bicuspidata NRRL YB-4993]